MERIVLVTDDAIHWRHIEHSFRSINADVTVLPPSATDDDIASSGAGLLIMGPDRIAPLGTPLRYFKTIIVNDGEGKLPEQTRASQKNLLFLQWPLSKNELLREAAAMLGISPRRTFRALVRIFSPDSEFGAVGNSIDFSSTGMSFTTERFYSIGHEVRVALSLPGDGGRLILKGRVARSWTNETDGSSEYGVEFKSLDQATAEALESFILS